MKPTIRRSVCGAITLAILVAGVSPGARCDSSANAAAQLTLEEARQYMLELINRDRAAAGLAPVALDPCATVAGQQHAREMAAKGYLSHWNAAGESPQQRFQKAGGAAMVMENAYLLTGSYGARAAADLMLTPAPTFCRYELERIERSYMKEVAPDDGHRRNILDPLHTHVGIAIAKSGNSEAYCVASTQEFVNYEAGAGPAMAVAANSPSAGADSLAELEASPVYMPAPMCFTAANPPRDCGWPLAFRRAAP